MMFRVDLPFYFSPFAETSIDPIRLFSLHAYRSRVSIASAGNDLPQFTPKLSVVGGFFCETRWWRKCMDKSAGMKLRRDDGEDVDAPAVSFIFFLSVSRSRFTRDVRINHGRELEASISLEDVNVVWQMSALFCVGNVRFSISEANFNIEWRLRRALRRYYARVLNHIWWIRICAGCLTTYSGNFNHIFLFK